MNNFYIDLDDLIEHTLQSYYQKIECEVTAEYDRMFNKYSSPYAEESWGNAFKWALSSKKQQKKMQNQKSRRRLFDEITDAKIVTEVKESLLVAFHTVLGCIRCTCTVKCSADHECLKRYEDEVEERLYLFEKLSSWHSVGHFYFTFVGWLMNISRGQYLSDILETKE